MDTGEGRFKRFEPKSLQDFEEKVNKLREKFPKSKGIFTEGEELWIRDSLFRVKNISPFGIKLKLLRQPENSADFCQCEEPDNDMPPYGDHCLACGKKIRG